MSSALSIESLSLEQRNMLSSKIQDYILQVLGDEQEDGTAMQYIMLLLPQNVWFFFFCKMEENFC